MAVSQEVVHWFNSHGPFVLGQLSKHIVGLTWVHALEEPHEESNDWNRDFNGRKNTSTTFLLAADKYCFLITAGHVLTMLLKDTAPPRRLVKTLLHVGLGSETTVEPINLPWEHTHHFLIDSEVVGLDYAAILLPNEIARRLCDAGATPIPESVWKAKPKHTDIHVLLGFPKETREESINQEDSTVYVSMNLKCPLLLLEQILDPEKHSLDAPYDRFCARILSQSGQLEGKDMFLCDINGMSGGPVFGLRVAENHIEYDLIAVQSSWDQSSGIIAACYIQPFIEAVLLKIREVIGDE